MTESQLLCYHRLVRWLNQKILLALFVLLFLSALPFSQPAEGALPYSNWEFVEENSSGGKEDRILDWSFLRKKYVITLTC